MQTSTGAGAHMMLTDGDMVDASHYVYRHRIWDEVLSADVFVSSQSVLFRLLFSWTTRLMTLAHDKPNLQHVFL